MITKPFVGVLCCVLAVMAAPGEAQAVGQPCLQVEQGWARLPPPGSQMSAGYARVRNQCRAAVTVVGASGTGFGEVTLHETRLENGVSRMQAVPTLEVPAGGSVELRPGGLHLMLMQPRAALTEGQLLPLQLQLADGSSVPFTVTVRRTAAPAHAH